MTSPTVTNHEIATIVKAARHRRKLTHDALARRSGISKRTIWRIENGGGCTLTTLGLLAEAMNMRLTVAFTEVIDA